jgi:hypothetical protein
VAEYKMDTSDKPDKKRDELKGKVLQLKDLVNYNEGTVASRMIISRKAGNITIFSFDESILHHSMRWLLSLKVKVRSGLQERLSP